MDREIEVEKWNDVGSHCKTMSDLGIKYKYLYFNSSTQLAVMLVKSRQIQSGLNLWINKKKSFMFY